jgi:dTDP-4-amino-4,6-dideoxygalactose transaminase
MDAIQAGLLSVKLPHLDGWNTLRRAHAAEYDRLFAESTAITLPHQPSNSRAIYHLYVIRCADRDGLIEHLKKAGIGTGIHYPIPLHLQKAYAGLHYAPGDFPVAERLAAEIVSLPMFPQLTQQQQARVVEETLAFIPNPLHADHS